MRRMLEGVAIAGLVLGMVFPVMADDTTTTAGTASANEAKVEKQAKQCNTDDKVAADIKHDQKVARRKAEKAFNKQQAAEKRKFFEKQKEENKAFRNKQDAERKRFLEMQAGARRAFHEEEAANAGKHTTVTKEVTTDKATDKDSASTKTE